MQQQILFRLSGLTLTLSLIMANAPTLTYANAKLRTITATGRGEVFIPQTIANMQLSVNENAKTALEATKLVRIKSQKLLKTLQAEKTLSIETTAVTVNPTTSYTNNKPQIIGYNANYTVLVKTQVENAGNIIDHAISSGVTIADEPKLSSSDTDRIKAEKEAIKLATLDAKSRAEASLSALGFKSITVDQITVQNIDNQPRSPMNFALMKSSAAATDAPPTQIISGKTNITAEVSLTLEY